jgi:hypothetical protein
MTAMPAPDNGASSRGGGCPVPKAGSIGEVSYPDGAGDICSPDRTTVSNGNRGDARAVIARFRSMPAEDQPAIIEFLKQL